MSSAKSALILRAHRPGREEARNSLFQDALELVGREPGLAQGSADERALDSSIRLKLRAAIKPPPDLKAMLLAQRINDSPPLD